MTRVVVAIALISACRGHAKHDAGPDKPASAVSAEPSQIVPHLPLSPEGKQWMTALDRDIVRASGKPGGTVGLLLDRASLLGDLADYQAALESSEAWIAAEATSIAAWQARIRALTAVHEFARAREALAKLRAITKNARDGEDLETSINAATGASVTVQREAAVKLEASPTNLTMLAASLASDGKLDDAIALIPRAAAAVHDNPPTLLSWLLFQWGRLYEQKGELAAARQFYEQAHARMPAYLEAFVHLAQTAAATGAPLAPSVIEEQLATNRHPELLALAGHVDEAKAEWERYLKALPKAFADHAARFFLGPGNDPARALALANDNLANRDTHDARALVVEAALAAKQPERACAVVDPLLASTRPHRFLAWRALASCGRTAEATRLAGELGIKSSP